MASDEIFDMLDGRIRHMREQLDARISEIEGAFRAVALKLLVAQAKEQQNLAELSNQLGLLVRLLLSNALQLAWIRADLDGMSAEHFRLFWHEPYDEVTRAVRAYRTALLDAYVRANQEIMNMETPLDRAVETLRAFETEVGRLRTATNLWGRKSS
jgi:hypothetical protein